MSHAVSLSPPPRFRTYVLLVFPSSVHGSRHGLIMPSPPLFFEAVLHQGTHPQTNLRATACGFGPGPQCHKRFVTNHGKNNPSTTLFLNAGSRKGWRRKAKVEHACYGRVVPELPASQGILSQSRGGKIIVRPDFLALCREKPITRQGFSKLFIVVFQNTGEHERACRKPRVETTIYGCCRAPGLMEEPVTATLSQTPA